MVCLTLFSGNFLIDKLSVCIISTVHADHYHHLLSAEQGAEVEEAEEEEKYDENFNEETGADGIHVDVDVDDDGDEEGDDGDEADQDQRASARPRRMSEVAPAKQLKPIPKASSLFLLSHTNPFRVFCNKIVNHSYFTNSVLVCILVSSAMLAAEDPLQAQSPRNTVSVCH
jgi:hypothetical protein